MTRSDTPMPRSDRPTPDPDALREAIERVRNYAHVAEPHAFRMAMLAVCDAAARCAEAEAECLEQARLNGMGAEREAALMAKLAEAEACATESAEIMRRARERAEEAERERRALEIEAEISGRPARADIEAANAMLSAAGETHYPEVQRTIERLLRERDGARETLSGIERLLRAEWQLMGVRGCIYFAKGQDFKPPWRHTPICDTLPDAVRAAVAELEKETT